MFLINKEFAEIICTFVIEQLMPDWEQKYKRTSQIESIVLIQEVIKTLLRNLISTTTMSSQRISMTCFQYSD